MSTDSTLTEPATLPVPTPRASRFDFGYQWHQLRGSPLTLIGLAVLAAVMVMMAGAPWIAPYDPDQLDLLHRLAQPSITHLCGTDEVGRDIFSRVIFGARTSVSVGLAVVAISAAFGTLIGASSGLAGGLVDTVTMRLMDVVLSFPSFVMAIALASALGPDLINAMLAIAVVRIPFYARLARAQALSLRQRPFVRAAVTFGASHWRIAWRHIVPNALAPIIVQGTLDIGGAILTASALSFIGLGAQQPTAEWGAMVSNGREFLLDQWWYPTFPGLAIVVTAIGFNLLGDGLRDILDPKGRQK
jgi:peptide/nickel transport system permease protein